MPVAPVLRAAHVRQEPAEAFRLFTDQIGAWWPLPTHGMFGRAASSLAFEDGSLVERSLVGEATIWGQVLAWEPPHRIVMSWSPGRSDGPASQVEVRFVGDDDGTRVELEHRGWEAYGDRAAEVRRSYVGPAAWGLVIDHYAHLADLSVDQPVADGSLDALADAQSAFFAEASTGEFGPGPEGEWTAGEVIAHVALNDEAMSAICRALIDGRDVPTFDNVTGHDRDLLGAAVARAGSHDGLVALGRARAESLRLLLSRLGPDELDREVAVHLVDHGTVVLEGVRPWGSLAIGVQARFHLPLHTEQLRSLRPS